MIIMILIHYDVVDPNYDGYNYDDVNNSSGDQ